MKMVSKIEFVMKNGRKGQEVKLLQAELAIDTDGSFGPNTEKAVNAKRRVLGLPENGLADAAFLQALGKPVRAGIDVSNCNGNIDWAKVGDAGIKFAFVKCTEGATFQDKLHTQNLTNGRAAGLAMGGYHYARPDTDSGLGTKDAQNEAEAFAKALGKIQKGDLRPAIDLEDGLKTDDEYNAQWLLAFSAHFEKLTGVKPIIYTALWAVDLYLAGAKPATKAELAKIPLWWASYGGTIEPYQKLKIWDTWSVWQWTGGGAVPGVTGKVDRDWMSSVAWDLLRV